MLSKNLDLLRKLPQPLSGWARNSLVYPRYWRQASKCRQGFRQYGKNYKNPILFVMGIPKSGSTWLEKLISTYPGYGELLIPEASLAPPGVFMLPDNTFTRMKEMLVLTKMHIHGNKHNVKVIEDAHVPYVVLYRDFRDVCISHYHYVKLTPWHNFHKRALQMTLSDYIDYFQEGALENFCQWVDEWDENRDKNRSILVRYEDLLADPHGSLRRILDLYELPATDEQVIEMVEKNSFFRLSGGRDRGQELKSSFFRKGKAGDWKTQFTQKQADGFRAVAGDWFDRHGYG
jgi:hypothetical protein